MGPFMSLHSTIGTVTVRSPISTGGSVGGISGGGGGSEQGKEEIKLGIDGPLGICEREGTCHHYQGMSVRSDLCILVSAVHAYILHACTMCRPTQVQWELKDNLTLPLEANSLMAIV